MVYSSPEPQFVRSSAIPKKGKDNFATTRQRERQRFLVYSLFVT